MANAGSATILKQYCKEQEQRRPVKLLLESRIAPGNCPLILFIGEWRLLTGCRGTDNPPPFFDFLLPKNCNETAWKQTLQHVELAYPMLPNAISHFNAENLNMPLPRKKQTFYELNMGCLQHDVYLQRQLMLLKKVSA